MLCILLKKTAEINMLLVKSVVILLIEAIITTGRKLQTNSIELAKLTAAKLKIPYIERKNLAIEKFFEMYGVKYVLVAKKNSLRLCTKNNEIFFHPSLAHLRIKNILNGEGDRMIEAMNLKCGMKILDCTLGLGADSIVESFIVGNEGNVTAIEINKYLAEVVDHGFKNFSADNVNVIESMRRINVINADYIDFLKSAADNSFDVVYFDPMFRHPLNKSVSLNLIRDVADHRALTIEAINEAVRVAKYRVVMKENSRSLEFDRLGFKKILGGKYSPIHYGVIEKNFCQYA